MRQIVPGLRGQLREAAVADASVQGSARRPVLQTIFSDGLTTVSLFIEPFDPQRHPARHAHRRSVRRRR